MLRNARMDTRSNLFLLMRVYLAATSVDMACVFAAAPTIKQRFYCLYV